MRSNSGARGSTSCDSEMCPTSGNSSTISSRARRSWSALTKLKRKHTAIDSTPSFCNRRTPTRTASSSRGRTTLPSKSQRSGMGMRARRRAIGSGGGAVGPDLLLVVPPELDLVAVALRGEEPGGGATHLDHRVVGRGRPVHEGLDGTAERLHVQAEGLGQLLDARQHPLRLVVGGRRRLVQDDLAVRRDADEVGERATHVDAHPVATLRHAHPPRPPPRRDG